MNLPLVSACQDKENTLKPVQWFEEHKQLSCMFYPCRAHVVILTSPWPVHRRDEETGPEESSHLPSITQQ